MTECPECGFPLGDDESICPACGLSVGGPTPMEGAGPVPEEPEAEAVLPIAPADEEPGRLCPECGTLNPPEARFCIRCRHSFAGGATFFGLSWVVVPAVLGVFLIVAVAAAFSMGAFGGQDEGTGSGSAATAGAETLATQAVNISRNATLQNRTAASAAGANNTTALATRTLNATPTRTVDPNATPWNAEEGSGIYHTEGGTHYVDASPELRLLRKAAAATPTPVAYGLGDGSGHATGPLSWVGTGNWTPGFIDLPAGDAQVVLLSKGTTAFVLVDEGGTRAGYGVFSPPGGTYTVPIPQAGRYVIAFGTANRTDSWSATVLLPGATGGQAAAPPVPTPNMELLSFSGTGGGTPGTFNLTPGTVHVQLYSDEMTMAYLKDPWGVTLSTTVAGPNVGGSTVAVTQSGRYRLDVWGTGAWSATVTWTGTPAAGAPTVPTVQPVTTLAPWNWTATPGAPSPSVTVSTVIDAGTPGGKALYIVGVDGAYPPYSSQEKDGSFSGFDVDSARWIADKTGFKVEFQAVAWDGIIPALQANKIDMIYSGMTITEERKAQVAFSKPYLKINQAVAIRTDSTVTLDDIMAGKTVIGVQRGTTGELWVQDELITTGEMPASNLKSFDNFPLAITALMNRQVDATVYDKPPTVEIIASQNANIIHEIDTGEVYGIAVRKEDTALLDTMNRGLDQIMVDPYWNQLKTKYRLVE